jgi:hypothetical protein
VRVRTRRGTVLSAAVRLHRRGFGAGRAEPRRMTRPMAALRANRPPDSRSRGQPEVLLCLTQDNESARCRGSTRQPTGIRNMNQRLATRIAVFALAATVCGCGHLPPPRPLGSEEIYVCQPFSAIRDRVPANSTFHPARIAPRHGTCY